MSSVSLMSYPERDKADMAVCGALELASKNIVSGSVRMVYAIIYSLFLVSHNGKTQRWYS
jgi:hypothetical protein